MYQSRVRPDISSRKHVAPPYSWSSRGHRSAIQVVHSFLQSSFFETRLLRSSILALITIGVVASLAGCGGIVYRNASANSGNSGGNSTTPELSGIACATQSLTGSQVNACTASLSATASSAVNVTLTSSNSALQVPSEVTIAAGANSGSFNAVSSAVSKTTSVTITGSANGVSMTDVITLHPQTISTSASLSSISCGTQSLTGAQSKACTVSLTGSASSATNVTLSSSSSALQVPSTVTISAGTASGSFNAVSSAVTQTTSVTITGSAGGITKTDAMTLYPATALPVSLSKLSCATLTLLGPTTTACSVYLSGAATSTVTVSLSSNNNSLQVPATVTVPANSTTVAFVATALSVTTTQNATITASSNGVSQSDVLQLDPLQASTQHKVELSWDAASSASVMIVGYNVYRSTPGSSYQLLNTAVDANTSYTDASVSSGQTYDYVVKSVDSAGAESSPSNVSTVTIP